MKKRLLSLVLAFVMLFSLLPATALAAEVTVDTPTADMSEGDTFTSDNRNATLPGAPEGYEWDGPERGTDCGKEQHSHSTRNGCYDTSATICGKEVHEHSWKNGCYKLVCERNHEHNRNCYDRTTEICGKEEHDEHSAENGCYAVTCTTEAHEHEIDCYIYTWTLTQSYSGGGSSSSNTQFAWNQVGSADSKSHIAGEETNAEAIGKVSVQYYNSAGVLTTLAEKATVDWSLITSRGVVITAEAGWKVTGISVRCNDNDGLNCSTFSQHMANMTQAYSGVTKEITFTGAEMAALWQLHVTASNGSGRGDPYWLCISVARDTTTSGGEEVQNYYDITYYNADSTVTPVLTGYVDSNRLFLETTSVDTLDRTAVNPITGNLFGAEFHVSGLTFLNSDGQYTDSTTEKTYQFLGWQVQYSADDGSTWTDATTDGSLVQPYSIVAVKGDVRLIARWQEVEATYSVTYQDGVDSEEVFKDQVYDDLTAGAAVKEVAAFNSGEIDATVDDSGNPIRAGYIFDGWVDPFGYAADPATDTVTGNKIYIATWKPDMAVNKEPVSSGTVAIGETVEWTITVINNSGAAQTFTLEDALSTSARGVNDREVSVKAVSQITANADGTYTIAAKTEGTITVTYTTALADSGMNLVNTVTITTKEGNYTFSDTAPGVPVEEAAAQLSVVKNVSSIGKATRLESKTHEELPEAKPGEAIVWTITVTNIGTADGYFKLSDELLADGVDYSSRVTIQTAATKDEDTDSATYGMYIVPKESAVSFTVSYTVTENDYGKELSNRAFINDRDDDEIDRDEAEPVDVEGKKYTVVYRYAGYVPADATSINDINSARGGEFKHGDIVTVAGVPTASGYVFSGWSSDQVDVSPKEFSMPASDVTIKGSWTPKVDVEKTLVTDNSEPIEIGDTVEWTITVKNNTSDAQTFTLTDKLTVDYHTHDITNIVTTTPDVVTENADDTWTLAAGKTAEFTAEFTVLDGDHGKTLENTATVKLSDGFEFSDDSDKDPKVEVVDKQLEVTKNVYNGITTAKVGDTIIWEIKVKNTGNTALEEITLTDSLVSNDDTPKMITDFFTDAACTKAYTGGAFALDSGADKVFYTKYTVTGDDAGATITNTAYAEAGDEDKTNDTGISEVPVKYTLTIELYYDSIAPKNKVPNYGTTVHYDNGAHWYVNIEGQENPTHYGDTIPLTLTKDGKNYVFDPVATTDPLNGVINGENVVVRYIYSPDEIGGTDPQTDPGDDIPDKYQVVVEYAAAANGKIADGANNKEVITIYAADGVTYAQSGTVSAKGSAAEAADGYVFVKWTESKNGGTATDRKLPAATGAISLGTVTGGDKFLFTASFTQKIEDISVAKETISIGGVDVTEKSESELPNAKVGDVIKWKITIQSTSNTTKTHTVYLEDILANSSGEVVVKQGETVIEKTTPITIDPNGKLEFIAEYTVQLGDSEKTLTNRAVVTEDGKEQEGDSGEIVVDPAYTVEKTTNQKTASVGETITWKIVVTNNSNVEIKGLSVEDVLSGTYNADAKATLDVTGTFDLAKDGSKTITATYVVQSDDVGHSINNTAIVSVPDGPEITDIPDEPVVINDPKLSVTKELAAGQAKEVAVGETITWNIKVRNGGNVTLTGIKLTDTLSNAVGTAKLYRNGSTTELAADFTFDLLPGTELNFEAKYAVQTEDAGNNIGNAVVATADDGTTSQDTEDPVKVKNPGLNVTKTADKTVAYEGETITYTIVVTNSGNVDLTGIKLTDTMTNAAGSAVLYLADGTTSMPSDYSFNLSAGDSTTYFAKYVVKSSDVGKKLANTATAAVSGGPTDNGTSGETEIIVPYIPPVNPDPPKLNKEDHFAYIIGKDDGLVHPLDPITRAETATIFFRMLLEESRQAYWTQENNYVDVEINHWFNNAASTLSNAGIITGRPGGYFAPYANISRAEFATLAVRFFLDENVEITENNLTDVKGHWAEANINLAYALGLITGYPDDSFRPDQEITRAEAMVIVNRVLERHPDKDHLLDNMITWPDNLDPNVWYYADVQEATNSHIYVMMTDKNGEKYEIWQQLLPVRDWAALEKEWSEYNSSHNPGEVVDINTNTP